MANNFVKKTAKETGIPIEDLDDIWKAASKEVFAIHGMSKGADLHYATVTNIFKKKMKEVWKTPKKKEAPAKETKKTAREKAGDELADYVPEPIQRKGRYDSSFHENENIQAKKLTNAHKAAISQYSSENDKHSSSALNKHLRDLAEGKKNSNHEAMQKGVKNLSNAFTPENTNRKKVNNL